MSDTNRFKAVQAEIEDAKMTCPRCGGCVGDWKRGEDAVKDFAIDEAPHPILDIPVTYCPACKILWYQWQEMWDG